MDIESVSASDLLIALAVGVGAGILLWSLRWLYQELPSLRRYRRMSRM